jgi:hypothetical protein
MLFAAARLSWTAQRAPVLTGDGHVWSKVARQPLWSKAFWFGHRPATLPLLYKLIGEGDERLVWAQTLIGILAWATLAVVVAEVAEGWLSLATFALVLVLGSTTLVRFWDVVIRSEALGLSFFILCFAATLRSCRRLPPRERRGSRWAWPALALASGALTAFARETNAYLLPLLGLLGLAGSWATRTAGELSQPTRRHYHAAPLALALSLTATCVACQANTRISGRYAFPLVNVIFKRVLPDRKKLAYFRDVLAMPVSDALLARRSRWASADHGAAFHAPELEDFRNWLYERGYSGYERYLLTHATLTVTEAARSFPAYARSDVGHRRRGSDELEGVDDVLVRGPARDFPGALLAFLFGVGVLGACVQSSRTRVLAVTTLFLAVATATQAYVCYHGDAMEVVRHGTMVGILLRLGALFALFTVLAAGRSMHACRSRRASMTTSPTSKAPGAPRS